MVEPSNGKLKRCAACDIAKPRDHFRRQVSGRLYRNCIDCHTPHSRGKGRVWWKTPEGKREYRRQRAEREGRAFRPGVPGRPTDANARMRLARDAAADARYRSGVAALIVLLRVWPDFIECRTNAIRRQKAARVRQFYQSNPERQRLRIRLYKAQNPEKAAQAAARRWRRAAETSDGSINEQTLRGLLSASTHCAYCGHPLEGTASHFDHVVPLSRGGRHSIDNLAVTCAPCNLSKSNWLIDEWPERPTPLPLGPPGR